MSSSAIDFRILPVSTPSLCIPRVFSNIDEKRIRRVFDELHMGDIDRIDIVNVKGEKGEKFNRVFVHFKCWLRNTTADTARERLLNGKEIKIIYDEPWFWKVSAYREAPAHPASKPRPQEKKKVTIQFDESDDEKKPFTRDTREPRDQPRPARDQPRPARDTRPAKDQQRHKDMIPVPKLKRNIAETFVPKSPSSSPRERERGFDINKEDTKMPLQT